MASRVGYTLPVTPSTPNFRAPAPPPASSSNWEAVRSPLLSPNEEGEPRLLSARQKSSWAETYVPARLRNFGVRNTGLLLIVASQAFYSSMNVLVKILNGLDPPVPPLELIFVRMLITYVCCTSYMLIKGVSDPWVGPKGVRILLVFRGFSGFFGLFGIYFSLQYLSLSDATVITFLGPSLTAIAGAIFLHEKLRMAEMYSALVSLVGVVLIARPSFIFGGQGGKVEEGATPAQRFTAVCLALLGAFGSAGAYTSIRAIGHRAHAMHLLTAFSSQCVIASTVLTLVLPSAPRWIMPTTATQILLFMLIGTLGFVAQALMTMGFQRETAGRGSMGIYAQIVFAALWDRMIFHSKVQILSVAGTMLIMGSALYVALTKQTSPVPSRNAIKSTSQAAEEGLLTMDEDGVPTDTEEEAPPEVLPLARTPRTSDEVLRKPVPVGVSTETR